MNLERHTNSLVKQALNKIPKRVSKVTTKWVKWIIKTMMRRNKMRKKTRKMMKFIRRKIKTLKEKRLLNRIPPSLFNNNCKKRMRMICMKNK